MSTVYSPFVNELKERMEFEGTFLVKNIQLHMDKNGKPYLNVILMDKTGEVEARVWDNATKLADEIKSQDLLRVAGKVNFYQGRKQVIIEAAAKAPLENQSLDRFVPSSAYDVQRLFSELTTLLETIHDPFLKKLALLTVNDPELKRRILRAPAAKTVHHAYAGGLLEHTLSVCRILDFLGLHYQLYYGAAIKRDHLLIGGLLHDIGKIFEMSFERATEYTVEGQMIGHHVLGCELVDRIANQIPEFPQDLRIQVKHLILAHHGRLEYGSPKVPHTTEALLVHYVDDLDSKVNTIMDFLASDQQTGPFTLTNKSFERSFLKSASLPTRVGDSPGGGLKVTVP